MSWGILVSLIIFGLIFKSKQVPFFVLAFVCSVRCSWTIEVYFFRSLPFGWHCVWAYVPLHACRPEVNLGCCYSLGAIQFGFCLTGLEFIWVGLALWPVSLGDLPVSTFPKLGLQICATLSGLSHESWKLNPVSHAQPFLLSHLLSPVPLTMLSSWHTSNNFFPTSQSLTRP